MIFSELVTLLLLLFFFLPTILKLKTYLQVRHTVARAEVRHTVARAEVRHT